MKNYKGTKTLEVLEGADNYNRWIADRIRPFIKSPVLEVGAGTGNISSQFGAFKDLTVTDVDAKLIKILFEKFNGKKNIAVAPLDISKGLLKTKKKFKTIFAVNVLEHIKKDEQALNNIYSMLDSNGKCIILVPAKKSVYSNIDKKLGHYRRYEKPELIKKLQQAGFLEIEVEYFNVVGLLSWYIRDKIDRNNRHLKPSHVKAFDIIVPFLKKIEPKKKLPFGISLIAVGIKK